MSPVASCACAKNASLHGFMQDGQLSIICLLYVNPVTPSTPEIFIGTICHVNGIEVPCPMAENEPAVPNDNPFHNTQRINT
jgi:hypothetical protein